MDVLLPHAGPVGGALAATLLLFRRVAAALSRAERAGFALHGARFVARAFVGAVLTANMRMTAAFFPTGTPGFALQGETWSPGREKRGGHTHIRGQDRSYKSPCNETGAVQGETCAFGSGKRGGHTPKQQKRRGQGPSYRASVRQQNVHRLTP